MKRSVTKSVEKDVDVLKYLTEFLSISKIAELRKCSRTVIYRSINRLLDKGYIQKIGNSYNVTDKGVHYLNKSSPNIIRLHNLAFKIILYSKPNNWELKRSKIVDCRAYSKEIGLNNNHYEIHNFKNIKVKTSNNSIIFYMPMFYGKDTDDCFRKALDTLFEVVPKVERLFNVVLIKDRKTNIEIISQHYAKLQDILAKKYRTEGNKLYVKDDMGNVRIICDYSFKVDELEAIYNKSAKEDMDIMQTFINDLLKNPATMGELAKLVQGVTANQLIFAKNMESHISAIKTLSKEVKGLSKAIKSIKKENNKLKLGNQKTIFEY